MPFFVQNVAQFDYSNPVGLRSLIESFPNCTSIVDIPKFDGNLFSMVVKYHLITRANLVGRTWGHLKKNNR